MSIKATSEVILDANWRGIAGENCGGIRAGTSMAIHEMAAEARESGVGNRRPPGEIPPLGEDASVGMTELMRRAAGGEEGRRLLPSVVHCSPVSMAGGDRSRSVARPV